MIEALETLYKYGGIFTVAISIASSIGSGKPGLSAGVPYTTWKTPSLLAKILSILPW